MPNRFVPVGYILFFASIAAGIGVQFDVRLAFLPAAVVFGWSQIGSS